VTHELSLMADMLRKVEAVAHAEGADHVICVSVRLGALAHISPGHLREHFEMAATGTVAEGARVDVEVNEDVDDPQAQEIVLLSVEVPAA
jgi:hydrogenase nickel incorporation protein HypA/HybF